MKILRVSFFDSDPWGDGGAKRTAQITEILRKGKFEEQCIKFKDYYAESLKKINFTKLQVLRIGIVILSKYGLLKNLLKVKRPHTFLANVGVALLITKDILGKFSFDYLILENTRAEYWYLPYFLHHLEVKYITIPHNLESLVPHQTSPLSQKSTPHWLPEELNKLALSSRAFTISSEESWLLSLYRIEVSYLPYWPTEEVYQYLLTVRESRNKKEKRGALIIGSAGNPPTHAGMLEIIDYFTKRDNPLKTIYLAGYQTDVFFDFLKDRKYNNIDLLGPISKDQLKQILESVECVIINQASSSGALTKIVELLIAGVPVIVNQQSTRSYQDIEGIYSFYQLEQINKYLSMELAMPPVPKYPDKEVNHFISYLQTWTGQKSQY